jgi:23S rRNA (adenine2503-C2)-methyltransferase
VNIVLTNLNPQQISEALDLQAYQGKQIFRWLHKKRVFDFEQMTDLSKALRQTLAERCIASQLEVVDIKTSMQTGTRKALFRLADGETVESVLIRDEERITLCLSSQAGCAMKCAFCATGQGGFRRNLEPGEIVEQALYLLRDEDLEGRTPNIVYMGMGEPFRNYDAVVASIRLLMAREGLGIGARKIAVSTAGEADAIERFAEEDWQVRLSVSLHAANDTLRSKLVPLNKRYPLERLREAIVQYQVKSGRQVTFEWTLLGDVNDSERDAQELVEYAADLKAAINLIPWNPVPGLPFHAPEKGRSEVFRDTLLAAGMIATLRQEKGQDIDAACGQLRAANPKRL